VASFPVQEQDSIAESYVDLPPLQGHSPGHAIEEVSPSASGIPESSMSANEDEEIFVPPWSTWGEGSSRHFNLSFLDPAHSPQVQMQFWTVESVLEQRFRLSAGGAPLLPPPTAKLSGRQLRLRTQKQRPFDGPSLLAELSERREDCAPRLPPEPLKPRKEGVVVKKLGRRAVPKRTAPQALRPFTADALFAGSHGSSCFRSQGVFDAAVSKAGLDHEDQQQDLSSEVHTRVSTAANNGFRQSKDLVDRSLDLSVDDIDTLAPWRAMWRPRCLAERPATWA